MTYKYELLNSETDVEEVMEAIKEAFQDSPYTSFTIDIDLLFKYLKNFEIDKNGGEAFFLSCRNEDDNKIVGFIAGSTLDSHFAFAHQKVGQGIVWWVHKDHRGKGMVAKTLQEGLEHWARELGLKYIIGGHYENEDVAKLKKIYSKMGYKQIEYSYIKELD